MLSISSLNIGLIDFVIQSHFQHFWLFHGSQFFGVEEVKLSRKNHWHSAGKQAILFFWDWSWTQYQSQYWQSTVVNTEIFIKGLGLKGACFSHASVILNILSTKFFLQNGSLYLRAPAPWICIMVYRYKRSRPLCHQETFWIEEIV